MFKDLLEEQNRIVRFTIEVNRRFYLCNFVRKDKLWLEVWINIRKMFLYDWFPLASFPTTSFRFKFYFDYRLEGFILCNQSMIYLSSDSAQIVSPKWKKVKRFSRHVSFREKKKSAPKKWRWNHLACFAWICCCWILSIWMAKIWRMAWTLAPYLIISISFK